MDAMALRQPTALRGAATRDALLDAAELLVAGHGFTTPSHRMIAGEAGTHVALVNYHFGSKEMLFEAAFERRAPRLVAWWRDALAETRQPATHLRESAHSSTCSGTPGPPGSCDHRILGRC